MEILLSFHMKLLLHLFFICTKDLLHSSTSITEKSYVQTTDLLSGALARKGKKVL